MVTAPSETPYLPPLPTPWELPQPVHFPFPPAAAEESSESAPPSQNLDYDELFAVALSSQKDGDYHKAITYYSEIIEAYPHIADVYINRGAAYESIGDFDLALDDLNTALELEPKFMAYNNRGSVYFKNRDYWRAIKDFSDALKLDPGNSPAYIHRGHAFSNLALYDCALQDYNEAMARDPGNAAIYTSLGFVYYIRGDHDNAIRNYDQALKLDSRDPYAYLNRGRLSPCQGR